MNEDILYIGISGNVVALDAQTGAEIWKRVLKPSQSITLVLRGTRLLAAAAGELWCLDASTGDVVWHNKLKGLGLGFVSIAGAPRQHPGAATDGGEQAAILATLAASSDAGCSDAGGGCD